jgi:hypothetical protein
MPSQALLCWLNRSERHLIHRGIWAGREANSSGDDIPDGATWRKLMHPRGFSRWTADSQRDASYRACKFNSSAENVRWLSAESDDKLFRQYCKAFPQRDKQKIMPGRPE